METQEFNIIDLIIKYLSGEASEADCQVINNWLNQNKENKKTYAGICDIWDSSSLLKENQGIDKVKALEKLRNQISQSIEDEKPLSMVLLNNTLLKWVSRIAAILFLPLGIALILMLQSKENKVPLAYNIISAPLGSKSKVELPDGTKVWLNAGSSIKYENQYGVNNRQVTLQGEAFFEVAKNEKMPFIVSNDVYKIKALGTSFNVKAYPDEDMIETTLITGVVTIEMKDMKTSENKQIAIMKPNQKIVLPIKQRIVSKPQRADTLFGKKMTESRQTPKIETIKESLVLTNIDIEEVSSWKDGYLKVQGETLESLAITLERHFNIEIYFSNNKIKDYKFSGKLKDISLEQVLDVIKLTSPIEYSIKENVVIISESKTKKQNFDKLLNNIDEKNNKIITNNS